MIQIKGYTKATLDTRAFTCIMNIKEESSLLKVLPHQNIRKYAVIAMLLCDDKEHLKSRALDFYGCFPDSGFIKIALDEAITLFLMGDWVFICCIRAQ
jgi:hypothetical protein